MSNFEVVDEWPGPPPQRKPRNWEAMFAEVVAGKVVAIPHETAAAAATTQAGLGGSAKRNGLRVQSHRAPDHTVYIRLKENKE